jgi:hypothetical protein
VAGKAQAVRSGAMLQQGVVEVGRALGLKAHTEVRVGRRVWGAVRRIDVVLTDPVSRKSLGVECKYQGTSGSAEEKIPTTIQDISAWPIRGLVVFAGAGFSDNMRAYLYASGLAVDLEDLSVWLELFFGMGEEA